jgi:predicted RNA binding protein YcfA (HicA-like mRNA interferase family)
MKYYSKDKDINNLVRRLVQHGWSVRRGKKHALLRSPAGKRTTIPSTPSDRRAWNNFSSDIKKMTVNGDSFYG